ncbi:MAG TPA: HEAT repeat domain-containing protein, partial [Nitrospirota bacterium]
MIPTQNIKDRRIGRGFVPVDRAAFALLVTIVLALLTNCAGMGRPLRERLTSPDERTQRSAFNDLDALDDAAKKEYLSVLKNLLYNKKSDTRVHAAMSLGRMGRAAKEAVPDLAHVLGEDDDDLRLASIGALGRMGADAVPSLVAVLNHPTPEVRHAAADALGNIGPEAAEAASALALHLGDQDRDTAQRAALALGKIGRDAVPVIVQVARRGDRSAVEMAETAFSVDKLDSRVVQDLVNLLGDESEEPRVRAFAAASLGRMREPAKGALPALVRALGAEHVDVRTAARGTLGRMGTAAVPTLMEALKDRRPSVRAAAASALGDLGPAAENAVPALLKAFQDEDRTVRIDAILAVGKTKVTSRSVVQALIRVLESDK